MTRHLQLVLWLAVLVALTFALWPQPADAPGNPADKLQHFGAFFTFAVLGGLAYPKERWAYLFVALAALGALIELAQLYPPLNRSAEWADLGADILGASAGLVIVSLLRPKPRKRRRSRHRGTRHHLAGSHRKPTRGEHSVATATAIFERLKQDHDRHRDLIGKIEGAQEADERESLFENLTIELKSHASAEEQALYSTMMRKPETTDETRHSVAEHHEIEVALNDLAATDIETDEWQEKFGEFKHDYLHHIDEEEEDHFPDFQRYLTNEDEEYMRQVFDRRKKAEAAQAEVTPEPKEEAKD